MQGLSGNEQKKYRILKQAWKQVNFVLLRLSRSRYRSLMFKYVQS